MKLQDKHDLAHWTYPLAVKANAPANIYTLHDLVPLRLPYTTLDNKKLYYKLLKRIGREADHIVTVSECSKRDIMELIGIEESRITNTYQSVHIPQELLDVDEEQVAREVEGATGTGYKEYYLFWGSIEPKKNIERIIEAFLASGIKRPLVIVGAQAWKSDDQLRLLKNESLRSDKRIIQLSYAPFAMGLEAAGRIVALGEGVEGHSIGDRVATFGPLLGAYATHRNIGAEHLFRVPDAIDDQTAAASMVKACTAEFLVERCAKVEAGWPVLVHAAAGGTGLLLVQWLRHIGAEVIGTVSTEAKAQAAKDAGAHHIIYYKEEDTAARTREITGGLGVRVTFDGIGRSTCP